MTIFKKKPKKIPCPNCTEQFDTEEQRNEHYKKEHDHPIEQVPIGEEQPVEEITLEHLISINTESWYKSKVLEQLIRINEQLETLNEIANESNNIPINKAK